jgi:peptidoglycan-associated lipoprotein
MRFMSPSNVAKHRAGLVIMLASAIGLSACARTEPGDHTALGSNASAEMTAQTTPFAATAVLAGAGGLPTVSAASTKPAPFELMKEELRSTGLDLVYFAGDSFRLTPEGRQTLIGQLAWLKQKQVAAITIEGHADERGTREYNIALSARRAAEVRDFLVSQGVAADRVNTRAYGKERPIVTCDDIICWSQNRRAQTVPTVQDDVLRSFQVGAAATVATRPWR